MSGNRSGRGGVVQGMTITAMSGPVTSHYPIVRSWDVAVADAPALDRAAVAALLGVEPDTITNYLNQSRPGGRYAAHPFPEPDFKAGRSPIWRVERREELIAWARARPGRGAGGGQPAHQRNRTQ